VSKLTQWQEVDEDLLPPINWWPMIFSIFVVYLPNGLAPREHASLAELLLTSLGMAAFVALVVTAAVCWRRRRPFLWVAAPFTVLGLLFAPYYPGAAVLCFIFASCIVPWAVNGAGWRTARLVTLVISIVLWEASVATDQELRRQWLIAALFCGTSAAVYVWVVRMSLNAHRVAKLTERKRIAADLHGLLGSALAGIATLATRAGQAPSAGALAEIESISRQTLAEVRRTIRGYRAETLDREVAYTPAVLTAAGSSIPSILWWPALISLFMAYLPGGLEMRGDASPLQWLLTGTGMVVFVALLAASITFWRSKRPLVGAASVVALIAVAAVPYGEIAALSPEFSEFLKLWWWFSIPAFSALCAAGFICVTSMSLGVHRLAKVSERERIARDLHDVLGHTLSVITLKAELGGRLLMQDTELDRTRIEIADIERVARLGLAEINQAIGGGAIESLDDEFDRAMATLHTAGIAVECRREPVGIDAGRQFALALALREAVTNIVRHAQAGKCSLRLLKQNARYVLEVCDDGRGGLAAEGLGLRGMRERIEAMGGSVSRETREGTRLTVRLPAVALFSP
jgi:signal transduction histidine kinase